MLPHVLGGLDDVGKLDLRRGVEIKPQPPGYVGRKGREIPGMQSAPADLRDRRETFDPIDLQIWLAIAGDFYELQQFRGARHGVALKEFLAVYAVVPPNHRARPPLQITAHPTADRLEITDRIQVYPPL